MRRDIVDPSLDALISTRFTDPDFLMSIAQAWKVQQSEGVDVMRRQRLDNQLPLLQAKRGRVLDAYVDGALLRADRDKRLEEIDQEMVRVSDLILRDEPRPGMTAEALAEIFQVFVGWELLNRTEKRRILGLTVPEIKVANYRIEGFYLFERGNEVTRKDKGSSRPQA